MSNNAAKLAFKAFMGKIDDDIAAYKLMGGEPLPRAMLQEMIECCCLRKVDVVFIDTGHPTHVIAKVRRHGD